MSKQEKIMNILFKLCAVLSFSELGLYLFNIYQPNKISIAGYMIAVGLFFAFTKYTDKEK